MKNNVPETIFACIDENTNQLDGNLWNKEDIKEYENELKFVEYVRKDLYDLLLEKCKRIEKETEILLGAMESINK